MWCMSTAILPFYKYYTPNKALNVGLNTIWLTIEILQCRISMNLHSFTHTHTRARTRRVVVVFMTTDWMTRIKMKILWKKASPIYSYQWQRQRAATSAPLFSRSKFIEHSNHIRRERFIIISFTIHTFVYPFLFCLSVCEHIVISIWGYVCVRTELRNQDRKSNWNVKGKTEIQIMTQNKFQICHNFPAHNNPTEKIAKMPKMCRQISVKIPTKKMP